MTWWRSRALVLVCCGAGLVETWIRYGPDLARLALVVALVAPLLWMRSHPAVAMLVMACAFVLQVPAADLRVLERTFVPYVAVIWGTYACTRHAASLVTLAAATAGPLACGATVGVLDGSVLSGVLAAGILTVPFCVGRAVRARVTARETLQQQGEEIAAATASAASAQASQSRARVAAELQSTLSDRVQAMVDQARSAAAQLPQDPVAAAGAVAGVEATGRSALHDMRVTLRVMREEGADERLDGTGARSAPVLPAPAAAATPRRRPGPSGTAIGLIVAAAAVVVFNLVAGFTAPADFVFPLLLVALAGVGVVAMQRQSELLAMVRQRTSELEVAREVATRTAAVQERMRLARELHDVVAHHLMVMVVQAGAARRTLESGRAGSGEALAAIERTGAEVIGELRSLLDLVDPGAYAGPAHGMAELGLLVERARASGLDVDLSVDGEGRSLPGGLDLAAHRIVQESLTNVIRHAAATRADVRIHYGVEQLTIEVADDGHGLAAGTTAGFGLLGMRERAEMYGGSWDLDELPGGGLRVRATLPLDRESVPR